MDVLMERRMTLDSYLLMHRRTTEDFAKKIGVSYSAACKWRQGTRVPRLRTIKAIHTATHGSVRYDDWIASKKRKRTNVARRGR